MINIQSDSRKIKKGDTFVALKCEVNDGHQYIDKAIENGASKVIAVDVGTNQMHSSLLSNPKLELHENTDIRNLNVEVVKDIEVAVIDTSFISVTKFVPIITKYPNLISKNIFNIYIIIKTNNVVIGVIARIRLSIILYFESAFKGFSFTLSFTTKFASKIGIKSKSSGMSLYEFS